MPRVSLFLSQHFQLTHQILICTLAVLCISERVERVDLCLVLILDLESVVDIVLHILEDLIAVSRVVRRKIFLKIDI